MILRIGLSSITINITSELKLIRIRKVFNCGYKGRGVPLRSGTRLTAARLRTKTDRRVAGSVRRDIRPERMVVRKKGLRVTPRKEILLFLLSFTIKIKDRITISRMRRGKFGIFKMELAIGGNLLAFSLLFLKGKKGLELLEVAKGGKVNLRIVGSKTGWWLPILKKQFELPKGIQIWVRSLTLRGIRRGCRISYKQIVIWIWVGDGDGVFRGRMRRKKRRIHGGRKKKRGERTNLSSLKNKIRWKVESDLLSDMEKSQNTKIKDSKPQTAPLIKPILIPGVEWFFHDAFFSRSIP